MIKNGMGNSRVKDCLRRVNFLNVCCNDNDNSRTPESVSMEESTKESICAHNLNEMKNKKSLTRQVLNSAG